MRKVVLAFFILALTLSATTLYTTGGTPAVFATGTGDEWQIGASGTGAEFTEVADSFTDTTSGQLGDIDLALSTVSGTGTVIVAIETGSTPTTVVESLTSSAPSATPSIVTIPSIAHSTLTGGSNYWLLVETSGSLEVEWWVNPVPRGTDFQLPSGGGWISSPGASLGAFDLQSSTAAPEPWSVGLVGVGMVIVVVARRRVREV